MRLQYLLCVCVREREREKKSATCTIMKRHLHVDSHDLLLSFGIIPHLENINNQSLPVLTHITEYDSLCFIKIRI